MYEWFQTNIQAHLPSDSCVRALLLVGVLIFMVVAVLIVSFHRYRHTFWQDKPMSWTTIFPSRTGIIQHSSLRKTHDAPVSVPDGYSLTLVEMDTLVADKVVLNQLGQLWETEPEHVVREFCAYSTGMRVLLLYWGGDGRDQTLVGSIAWSPPVRLHTPVDTSLPVFIVRKLTVHEGHRGKGLAPVLMEKVLHYARQVDSLVEPVALFTVPARADSVDKNRLPFSAVAYTMRMAVACNPVLLIDPETEVSHRVVADIRELPDKATESSGEHIATKLTLEPDASSPDRLAHWKRVLAHPHRRLLSIGGHDWMHLEHTPGRLDTPTTVALRGCSFGHDEHDKIVGHLVTYIRTACAEQAEVRLVVPMPLQPAIDSHHSFGAVREDDNANAVVGNRNKNKWILHDMHYMYMYNYKLNPANVHIPYTFDLDTEV
jgi:GNAT superfamily N-acetyltransferase